MTIDERLERLTERHEALTHTVELIAQMQIKTEKELERLSREGRIFRREVRNFRREVRTFRGIAQAILLDHEDRLRALEDEEGEEPDDDQDSKS